MPPTPEERRERRVRLKATDPEKLKERERRDWQRVKAKQAECPELFEKQKQQRKQRWKARNRRRRREALMLLGGRCQRCGIEDERVLQIDHLNGGGRQERGTYYNPTKLWKDVTEHGIEKFQLLCANCHSIKTWEDWNRY